MSDENERNPWRCVKIDANHMVSQSYSVIEQHEITKEYRKRKVVIGYE